MVNLKNPELKFSMKCDFENKIISAGLTIHPDRLFVYKKIEWITEPNYTRKKSLKNLEVHNNHNRLSANATKKLQKSIRYLLYTASPKRAYNNKLNKEFWFKVNFVTLTLSSTQIHSDQIIKSQLLNQFLIEAKKKWNLNEYVWKAELQENGNVHFHILSDTFIPYNELRNCWNRIQNKLGYVDRFTQSKGKKNPNSTDIHSLKKINNVAQYVSKYMSKNDKKRKSTILKEKHANSNPPYIYNHTLSINCRKELAKITSLGRIWGCSTRLTQLKGGQADLNDELLKEIENLQNEVRSKRINDIDYSIILFDSKKLSSKKYPLLYKLLHRFVVERFGIKRKRTILNQVKKEGTLSSA